MLLSGKAKALGPIAEAVLFSVARQDHVDDVIGDALARGRWVVCDRFLDSTRAYQGAGGGVPAPVISALERLTLKGVRPNLTFLLDVPADQGLPAPRGDRLAPGLTGSRARTSPSMSVSAGPSSTSRKRSPGVASSSMQASREALVAEDVWEAVAERLRP